MHRIKNIARTQLFKVSSLNAVSVIAKILIGLVSSKVLALFVGPPGLALVGNLRNFINSAETLSSLGFQYGIVKYVAENEGKQKELQSLFSTVFLCLVAVALLLSILLFAFADYWTDLVLPHHPHFSRVFTALAMALPWYAVSALFLSFINGLGNFRKVIYINIAGNLIGLAVSVAMIWQYQTLGALLSAVIAPALLFFVTLSGITTSGNFLQSVSFKSFDSRIVRNLSSYSLMAFVSAVGGPIVFLAIRNRLINEVGISEAGYWEAVSRISTYYLLFISTILSVYYLPKLSASQSGAETKRIFRNYYKGILPPFVVALAIVYFLRTFLIGILFSADFLPVSKLFFWQLLGDVFKAASLILGYQFLAKRLTIAYIATEIFSFVVMYVSSVVLIGRFHTEGVVMAHALTYFVYLTTLAIRFRKLI
ncbi:MAG TPA: O-antigen translocase [Flavobacterium sp.]